MKGTDGVMKQIHRTFTWDVKHKLDHVERRTGSRPNNDLKIMHLAIRRVQ